MPRTLLPLVDVAGRARELARMLADTTRKPAKRMMMTRPTPRLLVDAAGRERALDKTLADTTP